MTDRLPDGVYSFANVRLPMSEPAMMEPPHELEALLIDAARAASIDMIRDRPAEIRCSSEAFPDATFVAFWPSGQERPNILAPKSALVGRA